MNSTNKSTYVAKRFYVAHVNVNGVLEYQVWSCFLPNYNHARHIASFPTKDAAEFAKQLLQN